MRLTVNNVGKCYGKDTWGLRNVSMELAPGILALIGPNGAGKSTFMRILATIAKPTQGQVSWNGVNVIQSPRALRSILGYLPQDFGVYPHLSGREFLAYMAALKGMHGRESRRRIQELLAVVNLSEVGRRLLGSYSAGMRQRIGIAQALLNHPQLLIADEPTAGLDPAERIRFRNLLSDLAGKRIVILSTHIVSDAETTATEIAIINRGRLLQRTEPERLLRAMEGRVWHQVISSAELTDLRQTHLVSSATRRHDGVHVRVLGEAPPDPDALPLTPTLEDAYLYTISNPKDGSGDLEGRQL